MGFLVIDWGFRLFSDIEKNSTNKCIYAFFYLLVNTREPQSMNAKSGLPIIPIGIVAYAFTLLWDNLCRNSCILKQLFTSVSVKVMDIYLHFGEYLLNIINIVIRILYC